MKNLSNFTFVGNLFRNIMYHVFLICKSILNWNNWQMLKKSIPTNNLIKTWTVKNGISTFYFSEILFLICRLQNLATVQCQEMSKSNLSVHLFCQPLHWKHPVKTNITYQNWYSLPVYTIVVPRCTSKNIF